MARGSLRDEHFRIGYENRAGFATVTTYTEKGAIAAIPWRPRSC